MAKAKDNGKGSSIQALVIPAPRFQTLTFRITGDAPYVQNKFSAKAKAMIKATQEAGSQAKKGKKREPKDFQQCYEDSLHKSDKGWFGIPAPSFRCAMISACRMVDFKMTRAKLSVFIEADGFDADDHTPLVKILKGEPEYLESTVRNASGVVDLRARGLFREGWEADVRVRFDLDQFSAQDVANLLMRAGQQVGIGEGRPDSKASAGLGWGLFSVKGQ